MISLAYHLKIGSRREVLSMKQHQNDFEVLDAGIKYKRNIEQNNDEGFEISRKSCMKNH